MKLKKYFYYFLHLQFVTGIFYAFAHFVTTSRKFNFFERRLWAYETWIILSFYSLFLFLTMVERDVKVKNIKKPHIHLKEFRKLLLVNLVLLVFPWGLFLLAAPSEMLILFGLRSVFWKVLGGMSLVGAIIYYFPYRFYKRRLTYYILLFGSLDNFVAGTIITFLFIRHQVPLTAWSATPLLFYFAYFFKEQAAKYHQIVGK